MVDLIQIEEDLEENSSFDNGTTDEEEDEDLNQTQQHSRQKKIFLEERQKIREVFKEKSFFSKPFLKPLLMPNMYSEARDMDASERNFLSWLKTSLYLSIAGAAVMINLRFHDSSASNIDSTQDSFFLQFTSSFLDKSNLEEIQYINTYVESDANPNHLFTLPLGFLFYALSFLSIVVSFANYISTINGYFRNQMVVTHSFLTSLTITIISLTILASNVIVLWRFY